MDDVLEDVGSGFLPIMGQFFTILRTKVIPAVRDIIAKVQGWLAANKPLVDNITAFIGGVLTTLITFLGNVVGAVGSVIDSISNSKPAMAIITTAFSRLGTAVGIGVDLLTQAFDWSGKVADAMTHLSLPDITGITDLIPHFATGGRMPGPVGAPGLAILHGGEEVHTSGSQSRGGSAAGFEAVAISKRDLARAMDQEMYFMLRRAAPAGGRL